MKKLHPFCTLYFVFCTSVAFAYTQTDVDNAKYLAGKGIITSQSTVAGYRLDDTITRAEVAGIALKLRGTTLPEGYACKRYFGDTIRNDWICRAVELAADAGLVSRSNTKFRPGEKITRAEAFAIIYKSSGLSGSAENYHFSTDEGEQWQKDLFNKIYNLGLSLPGTTKTEIGAGVQYYWTPNRNATRAEIFGFAKTMKMISGTGISSNNQIYINNHYKFSINYPQNSTISGNEQDTYIRIQNYPADRETMGLSQNEYYLEMHLGDIKVCEDEIQSPKEFSINGVKGLRGFGQSGGDAGGIRYALCINNKNWGYYIQVTEKTQNGSFAEEILNSFNFIN